MRRLAFAVPLVLALGALLAPWVLAADKDVTIQGFAFAPDTVTVTVGDTVTWTNQDGATHTATADGGAFNTGSIGSGSSKSVTFHKAGTYAYHCNVHPAMTATVVVEAAAGGSGGDATAPPTDTAVTSSTKSFAGGALTMACGLMFVLLATRLARSTRRS